MWLLLGLLGSVTALSASDMFTAQAAGGADADEDADDPQSDEVSGTARASDVFSFGVDYPGTDGESEEVGGGSATEGAVTDPALGRFDGLGERVHSSDTYPTPPPDAPMALEGDATDDNLAGGATDDSILGHAGEDSLAGHAGADWIEGGSGDDSLLGGEGDDTLLGGDGADTLVGGLGQDLLVSGPGANTLMAGDGEDTLIGEGGPSFLNGGAGNDLLHAGAGNTLNGGGGSDLFRVTDRAAGAAPSTILDYTEGEDEIQISYDPALGVPDLSITFDPEVPGLAEIRLAGVVLANVANASGLSVSDITLIARSDA